MHTCLKLYNISIYIYIYIYIHIHILYTSVSSYNSHSSQNSVQHHFQQLREDQRQALAQLLQAVGLRQLQGPMTQRKTQRPVGDQLGEPVQGLVHALEKREKKGVKISKTQQIWWESWGEVDGELMRISIDLFRHMRLLIYSWLSIHLCVLCVYNIISATKINEIRWWMEFTVRGYSIGTCRISWNWLKTGILTCGNSWIICSSDQIQKSLLVPENCWQTHCKSVHLSCTWSRVWSIVKLVDMEITRVERVSQ